ncbi:MAG: hypothetical protein QUS33_11855 [Dehalococcoidia bacterium]|nr:hypothetical protein [Dehalococcoidia bacterium]
MDEREKCGIEALSVFLMGLGVFLLVLGPCSGLYPISHGLIALVASWVLAITIRVFFFGGGSEETHQHRRYY